MRLSGSVTLEEALVHVLLDDTLCPKDVITIQTDFRPMSQSRHETKSDLISFCGVTAEDMKALALLVTNIGSTNPVDIGPRYPHIQDAFFCKYSNFINDPKPEIVLCLIDTSSKQSDLNSMRRDIPPILQHYPIRCVGPAYEDPRVDLEPSYLLQHWPACMHMWREVQTDVIPWMYYPHVSAVTLGADKAGAYVLVFSLPWRYEVLGCPNVPDQVRGWRVKRTGVLLRPLSLSFNSPAVRTRFPNFVDLPTYLERRICTVGGYVQDDTGRVFGVTCAHGHVKGDIVIPFDVAQNGEGERVVLRNSISVVLQYHQPLNESHGESLIFHGNYTIDGHETAVQDLPYLESDEWNSIRDGKSIRWTVDKEKLRILETGDLVGTDFALFEMTPESTSCLTNHWWSLRPRAHSAATTVYDAILTDSDVPLKAAISGYAVDYAVGDLCPMHVRIVEQNVGQTSATAAYSQASGDNSFLLSFHQLSVCFPREQSAQPFTHSNTRVLFNQYCMCVDKDSRVPNSILSTTDPRGMSGSWAFLIDETDPHRLGHAVGGLSRGDADFRYLVLSPLAALMRRCLHDKFHIWKPRLSE
jgi:hypothetical protein